MRSCNLEVDIILHTDCSKEKFLLYDNYIYYKKCLLFWCLARLDQLGRLFSLYLIAKLSELFSSFIGASKLQNTFNNKKMWRKYKNTKLTKCENSNKTTIPIVKYKITIGV